MKKLLTLMLLSIVVVLSACGTSTDENSSNSDSGSSDKKVLVMGTSADYAPFEYIDTAKSDDIIGFDIDLANALGEKLGYEIQVKDMDFSGLISALQSGKVDLVLSGMSPTPERAENVDFSDVYYTSKDLVITTKDSNIKTVQDLEGKKVGVQLGSIQEDAANEIAETVKITVENRDRIPQLIQEIKAGRFDAAIIEDVVATGYLNKEDTLTSFPAKEANQDAGSAIAFPKGSELTSKFNDELKKMQDSGEIDELIVKWFDN
ncbi:transporter substrate-binding domain-containing protein [Niallia sp. Sow4_A1]|jgi:arginine/lysine/histidine transporter system substrate-binding protein|uniref:transporter substrate-binding domain-containing protein n=1 Tax=Bacillaceae TaxID=186817 RepID=UPI0004E17DDF|nr:MULTISPECIES: transporter substrate-binding domain-containing protein [Bacillaceae]MCF2649799.1 transporter substrate-binding domain-containing protein [Niallia circulans]MCM3362950.1 transporter substrate-binding domain-containing protein [Niallia sp. MER TA 168]CAI9388939.1 Arginine-binding extracellular protein ArtP [Bacillus sp. T2.9-1]